MAKYEVHIPPTEGGFNVTLRVDADNWMAALKTGLQKLGEQGSTVKNVLVDIQDDGVLHITESRSGRVFRIREMGEGELESPGNDEATRRVENPLTEPATQPNVEAVKVPVPAPVQAAPVQAAPVQAAPVQSAPVQAAPAPGRSALSRSGRFRANEPERVIKLEEPSRPVGHIGRARDLGKENKEANEDLLVEVFERVQEIYLKGTDQDALYFVLDLALEKIPAEAGSVFRADAVSGDLTFAAVRGPKAELLLKDEVTIPAGTGIVGFCATEGVSVAVSDVMKDARWYSAIAARINYETRSMLCSPMMTHGRTFGCIQLLNKKDSSVFTDQEVGLLSYIAHQTALFLNSRL